jgi:HAMP domain-containing protein
LVLLVSGALVRPLRRLTEATHRIADGEYDLEVRSLVKSRFPDEIYELGESFEIMAAKVGARERSLTKEVQRLRVEIDTVKREQSVEEITGTDFFSDLKAKAAVMRARMHEDHEPTEGADGAATPAAGPSAPDGPA